MNILPDYGRPYIIDSITTPMIVKHHWVLSGSMLDFMLAPIYYLEETTGPTVRIMIDGFELDVPSSWNILVTDGDTYIIDTIQVSKLAGNPFKAVLFTPADNKPRASDIFVIDYKEKESLIHPLIQKGQMFCHPIGPQRYANKEIELACVIGPHDLQRHLTGAVIGDLL